jgi:YceI-like domain
MSHRVCICSGTRAEEISVELDPGKTEVAFVLSDVLHTVHGTFRLKQGHVSFDPDSNAMNGEIVVDAASGNSGSSARDKRMTPDVLEAQRFPEIRFAPAGSVGSIAPSGLLLRPVFIYNSTYHSACAVPNGSTCLS